MNVEIKELNAGLAPHFIRLNRDWIERLFKLVPADEAILSDPARLVNDGGCVLFVIGDGAVVGTGGLQKLDATTVEVVKMAVDSACHGQGLGGRLMAALLRKARELGFAVAYIETNSALTAANAMYRKFGFEPTGQTQSRHGYERADVFYELKLTERNR